MYVLMSIPFLIAYIIIIHRTKDIFNPVTVPFLFFTIPSALATLKISSQQVDFSTMVLLVIWLTSYICVLMPVMLILINRQKPNLQLAFDEKLPKIKNTNIVKLFVFLTFLYIVLFLFENYLLYDMILPIRHAGDSFFGNHYENVPVVGYYNAIAKYTLPVLWIIRYHKTRNRMDLLMAVIVILIPITRMQRASVMNNIIVFMLVLFKGKIPSIKKIIFGTGLLGCLGLLFSWVGYVRVSSKFYGDYIGLPSSGFFSDMFNIYYGYFSFSFDTLQRSLDAWISNGMVLHYGVGFLSGAYYFFQLDNLINLTPNPYDIIMSQRVFLNGATVLPTALHQFILDFGIIGGILVVFIMMLFYVRLYIYSNRSSKDLFLYAVGTYFMLFLSYYSPFMSIQHVALLFFAIIIYNSKLIYAFFDS